MGFQDRNRCLWLQTANPDYLRGCKPVRYVDRLTIVRRDSWCILESRQHKLRGRAMATHSYIIFQLRVHVRNRPRMTRPLNDVDGRGTDLLSLLRYQLQKSRGVIETDDRIERAHRVDSFNEVARTIILEGKAGPYGINGTSVDLDTGDERDFTDRTANMNPLRSMFLIPAEGYDGLIFCERSGASHFKGPLTRTILRPIGDDLGLTIKTLAHVDAEAWSRFLDDASISKITAVYRSTRVEDLGPNRGREQDLKVIAGGRVASRIGKSLGRILSSIARQGSPVAYNIDEYPELRPGDQDHYEQERLELQVGDGSNSRLIVVERSELPQFTYPLGERPLTRTLQQVWTEHGRTLLSDQDANIVP